MIDRTGTRLGVDQHADKRNHVEENNGWITVAIRPEGIARNGMSIQYLSPASAEALIIALGDAVSKAHRRRFAIPSVPKYFGEA